MTAKIRLYLLDYNSYTSVKINIDSFFRVSVPLQVKIKSKLQEITVPFATMNTIHQFYCSVATYFVKAVFQPGLIENKLVLFAEPKLWMTHLGEMARHHISFSCFRNLMLMLRIKVCKKIYKFKYVFPLSPLTKPGA